MSWALKDKQTFASQQGKTILGRDNRLEGGQEM